MNKAGELFVNAIENWRDAKGVGTAIIPFPLNDKTIVLGILQRVYSSSPTCKTFIITTTFNERNDISEFLTSQQNDEENNEEFKKLLKDGNIKIVTYDFIERINIHNMPLLCIVYHPESMCEKVAQFVRGCKFKLIVLNKLLANADDMTTIYKLAPILDAFKQQEVEQVRLSTPVEEIQIGVDIPADSEDAKLLNYFNEYVSASLAIFGSFDIMQQANTGNAQLNISANQICSQIAYENGWNEYLDMSIEFNIEIDSLYNPMNLKDRASKTYEIIRNRNQFLSDYKAKLDVILNIVHSNSDKKILIINKRADFASVVSEYINNLSDKVICLPYHDKLENIPAVDVNGNPIVYKSGQKKGQRKMMGSQAQKTYAEQMFNIGNVHVISTNNAPDKNINIEVDIIIITSPMCENISSYMYRLSNIIFRSNKVDLYTIYCRNTTEQRHIENQTLSNNHSVKNSFADENNADFVVVD